MHNKIHEIAGIMFALAFIAILSLINMGVIDIGNSTNNQLAIANSNTESHELEAFNNTTVTGATVLSAIKNRTMLASQDLEVIVDIDGTETVYNDENQTVTTNPEDDNYINPATTFEAELVENSNGIVTGIKLSAGDNSSLINTPVVLDSIGIDP